MEELFEEITAFLSSEPIEVHLLYSNEMYSVLMAGRYIIVEDNNLEVVRCVPLYGGSLC